MPAIDALTAAREAVPRRRSEQLTLGDCARAFLRRPSPPILIAAVVVAVAARGALGQFSWRDLVMVAGLAAATPPVEWLIHVYLLHSRPFTWRGRTRELLATREHRWHHEQPSDLSGVLIPRYAVLVFLGEIAVTTYLIALLLSVPLGGSWVAYATTGVLTGWAILGTYEWCHFLIHTPYRAQGRYYRAIWRGHRLHHFKNERYWFGITSTVADRLAGTAPDQRSVGRSATARNLRG